MNLLRKNVKRRIIAAQTVLEPAFKKRASNTTKSAHLRASIVILCSVVEGLAYELVEKHAGSQRVIGTKTDSNYLGVIKAKVLSTGYDVVLSKRVKIDLCLDERTSFDSLNCFLMDKKIINKRQFRTLNSIKNERNRIHIQGIDGSDINYTVAKVTRLGKAMIFLMKKIIDPV